MYIQDVESSWEARSKRNLAILCASPAEVRGAERHLLNTSRQKDAANVPTASNFIPDSASIYSSSHIMSLKLWRFNPSQERTITGLISETKGDFDCLSLFCLLVWEGAISIALTVHQSFWNWILVRGRGGVFHKTPTITDAAISLIRFT